jgi:hypothetical protein
MDALDLMERAPPLAKLTVGRRGKDENTLTASTFPENPGNGRYAVRKMRRQLRLNGGACLGTISASPGCRLTRTFIAALSRGC